MPPTAIDFDAYYSEWQEDMLLPGVCVHCGGEMSYADHAGRPYCEDCQYRGEFLDWGHTHHWPALAYEEREEIVVKGLLLARYRVTYAISADQEHWILAAVFGTEDYVLSLVVAIDQYERRQLRRAAYGRITKAIDTPKAALPMSRELWESAS